ncbi:MAG: SDR family NAD(P)-dependent oxidoreductase [Marinibacterium sp.]
MKRALVIGDSGGIGGAVRAALTASGVDVTGLSRRRDGLDLTDEGAVAGILDGLAGDFDMIFVATGGLAIGGARPEKTVRAISASAMADQFALNAIGPALILRAAPRLLARDRRAVFAALSARVGSIGDNRLGGWIGYRAAKAALNQIVHTAAIELARSHPEAICVALHPGTVATDLTRAYLGRHDSVSPADAAANLLSVMDGLNVRDTGGFFDWAGKTVPW